MTDLRCPACPGRRQHRHYLCPTCWASLPNDTRHRLMLRDDRARVRLRQLHNALTDCTPLPVIRVSR